MIFDNSAKNPNLVMKKIKNEESCILDLETYNKIQDGKR